MGTLIVGTRGAGGGSPAGLVAFNTETGAQLWRTTFPFDTVNYSWPSAGVFVGTSFYVLQPTNIFLDPLPPTSSELIWRINPNNGTTLSSFAFHPTDSFGKRLHVRGEAGLLILPTPIAGFLVTADMSLDGIPTSLKFRAFHLNPSTGEVDNTYSLDAVPINAAPSGPGDYEDANVMAVDSAGVLHYGNSSSGVWRIKRFDLVNNTQLSDFISPTVVKDSGGFNVAMTGLEKLPNGDFMARGGFVAIRFDRNGVELQRLVLSSTGSSPSPSGFGDPATAHPIGPFIWSEGFRDAAGALTNSDIWKLPARLTNLPTAPLATITPKFTDSGGTEHVVAFMVSTFLDLPLRQRQRDDCMEPGSARPCTFCFTLKDGSEYCIPPFWLRLTASVTFGGRVGPRNSYN